ncbi:MAG: acyl-[acyl-carrier-protein]--UDP-N-acetylglucosamine O-acyltransferase, partial [Gammaproteobacteria bacterium]
GDNNLLMPYVHVAHDCVVGNGNTFANNSGLAGHVVIGNYVTLGGYSLIHQFCSVGDYAFLGMSTGVVMDIPAFVKAAYHPAKVVGLNSIGMSRNGVSDESASLLKKAYKLLYRRGLRLEDSINKIVMLHEETKDENLKIFINSIKASTRGITR